MSPVHTLQGPRQVLTARPLSRYRPSSPLGTHVPRVPAGHEQRGATVIMGEAAP